MLFNLNGAAITFYGILVEYALKLQGGAEPLQICARPVVQRGSAVSTPNSLHTVVDESIPILDRIVRRPENITEGSLSACVPVQSIVDIAEPMGSESLVYLMAGTGNLIARIHGEHLSHMGQRLTAQVNMEKVVTTRMATRLAALRDQD
jgi:ABC-type sugar transport system ATPase subunit